MKDQHTLISGYRDLSQEEIDLMNEVKAHGAALQVTLEKVKSFLARNSWEPVVEGAEPLRWLAIGKTDLQKGLMAVTRAVARPGTF